MKDIKVFLKKKTGKKEQYGRKRHKNLAENKIISWLSIEKNVIK